MSRRGALAALLLGAFLLGSGTADAHETRPGYLELREIAPGTWSLFWKQPARGELVLRLAPVFSAGVELASGETELVPGALLTRTTLTAPGGLAGETVTIAGLETTLTDVLVRIHHRDGTAETHLARPAATTVTFGGRPGTAARMHAYFTLGVEHIATGIDHLLFVLGLVLIVRGRWRLLEAITAFTIAHSLTLAAATLGWASVPARPVEASIALSILFLAPEIARARRGGTSPALRHPGLIAFAFGLLHGFGFAGALGEMGLPPREIPLALLCFNLGVEAGQVAFVLLVLALSRALRGVAERRPAWLRALPEYAIGSIAAYWTIDRGVDLIVSIS